MHFLKKGQNIRAWVDPLPLPLIRAMPERKRFFSIDVLPKVADLRGPAETLDFTDLAMMSFPKAKRFTDHYSAGPGPNAYDITSFSSEKSVGL